MNEEIENIFNNFTVNGVVIPIAFIKYFGKAETYITYQSISNNLALSSDDIANYSKNIIDIDVYTKGNYIQIIEKIKEKMKQNDFVWKDDSPDMYETDTGFYHKTLSFVKEMEV